MNGGLHYRKGNLLDCPPGLIIHSVNFKGVFGAGVALQISERWPEAKASYLEKFRKFGWGLGDILIHDPDEAHQIAHMATQIGNGRYEQQTVYHAVIKYAKISDLQIHAPKFGSGLAGGDWKEIERIIRGVLTDEGSEVRFNVYTL
jgi:O-acetyl-ADP-ribose deacetylase (regulator of RNase III)